LRNAETVRKNSWATRWNRWGTTSDAIAARCTGLLLDAERKSIEPMAMALRIGDRASLF
jgi:hypothetical protein